MAKLTKHPFSPETEDDANPEWTAEDFAKARPAAEVLLGLFEAREQVKTAKNDRLSHDIAKGLNDAKIGRVKEIDFESLKQNGRQLLQSRNAA